MRYRLGSLSPRPGSSDATRFMRHARGAEAFTRAQEEMLRLRLSVVTENPSREPGELPDLLQVLEPQHPDRAWVEPVHAQIQRLLAGGTDLRLLACEYEEGPEGFLTLAACAPGMQIEVVPDDWMQIGFAAMREGSGPVRAWPRLLREVCCNGSLVCVGEFERHEGSAGIADAIRGFLAPEMLESAVAAMREAGSVIIRDPRGFLDEFVRVGNLGELLSDHMTQIEDHFEDGGDQSLYGLVNAVTATARDIEHWPDRLELEELAGRIAWLQRPVPGREGAGVLTPA